MKATDIELILDGCALLDADGYYYEYCCHKGNRLVFQSVNDDSTMSRTYDALLRENWNIAQ